MTSLNKQIAQIDAGEWCSPLGDTPRAINAAAVPTRASVCAVARRHKGHSWAVAEWSIVSRRNQLGPFHANKPEFRDAAREIRDAGGMRWRPRLILLPAPSPSFVSLIRAAQNCSK